MSLDIMMPKMGESVQEGTILRWLKKPGDTIERDEIIAEISTDKVDTEIPSPYAGVLSEILFEEGSTVLVGVVIAKMGDLNDKSVSPQPQLIHAPEQIKAPEQIIVEIKEQDVIIESPVDINDNSVKSEIRMPKMGESVQEGTILRWLKKIGDSIERDEIIAEISTDKVDTEIPSPLAGFLVEIVAQEGAVVPVNEVIAYISSSVKGTSNSTSVSNNPIANKIVNVENNQQVKIDNAITSNSVVTQSLPGAPIPRNSNGKFYSPLVRSIAEKENVSLNELDSIKGSGDKSRVTKSDLLNYLNSRSAISQDANLDSNKELKQTTAQVFSSQPKPTQSYTNATQPNPDVEIIQMDRMRQLIAEHMVRSKQTSPHVSGVAEADLTKIVHLREKHKIAFEKREGVKLTFTPFFIYAIAKALRNNPWINASVEGTNIILKKRVNLGMATALPDGNLIVPVIKDADRLSLSGVAHAVHNLANKARTKALTPDDISGGTFTLTNYGVFGMLHGAPIINQPQLAILGTGAVQKKAVVRQIEGNDMIVIRSMVYLSISHDHRVIDGMLGGKFLSDVVSILEGIDESVL